ncbi:protein adenylyltransferase SelO [Beijerinckia mobilis]|uniref:protein adenylyltransferase SelO n=1 Tax=Beijerinckia mobilis TaxID=231434 RepID=UPI00054F8711|nr:YdiU family protein [Beijerinckia mobilis]
MTRFPFEHSYGQLPDRFFAKVSPTPVAAPRMIRLNRALAADLGLDAAALDGPEGAAIFAGNQIPPEAEPIAIAYAGHQFGQFVPQLGDGRAILLGELIDREGHRRDIQLKGAGRTPFSRRGDGRAALGPVLREYLISEAMAALGVPTTRALAAVLTGEQVARETFLPGAVFTRVAASHIRVGTFQFFAARGDVEGVRALADHVITRHYPALAGEANPYLALLNAVIGAVAALVAQWMGLGFIHGVMNTDNMSVAGETIDYGPCAFMEAYDPETVFSSIDHGGRYAYNNQPLMAQWNLARLAETLIPLIDPDPQQALTLARAAIAGFDARFQEAYLTVMRKKFGFFTQQEEDAALIKNLFAAMARSGADFTLTFRALSEAAADPEQEEAVRRLFANAEDASAFLDAWRKRLEREEAEPGTRREAMRAVNPAYIPRNHRVEAVITAAVERDDFAPFEELLAVVTNPYADQPEMAKYREPAAPHERVTQTFCGT